MAKRPRQHQLEDESLTAFRAARPSLWPVRKKDEDYGIDLEVEIFDTEENSTGLLFYVQLKATDDEHGRKVVLGKEYLSGICQYDTVTIIARYFARDRKLYWSWASDLRTEIPDDQSTKTFHFLESQTLDADAFKEIENALLVARQLDNLPPNSSLGMRLDLTKLQGRRALELRRSLERIQTAEMQAITFYEGSGPSLLEGVVLEVSPEAVRISLGPRYTTLLEIDDAMSADLVAGRTLYAIANLLNVSGLSSHATLHAKNLLELGIKTDVRLQAADTVQTLQTEAEAYVNLAILNELHALQDVAYVKVLFGIYERSGHSNGANKHSIRFLEAALQNASEEGPQAEGVILYSMANAARQIDIHFAFSIYMRAKRKKPEYTSISYFQREVAGCLYLLGRFRCARALYHRAGLDFDSPLDCLVYGDTCLFSGRYEDASRCFEVVRNSSDTLLAAEGGLKSWLALRMGQQDECSFTVSALADRFNNGVSLAHKNEYEEALVDFLPCCLLVPVDHESWINAAICSHNLHDVELYAQILTMGFHLEGEALLESIMKEFDRREVPEEMYGLLSNAYSIVRSITSGASPTKQKQMESNFDAVIRIDGGDEA